MGEPCTPTEENTRIVSPEHNPYAPPTRNGEEAPEGRDPASGRAVRRRDLEGLTMLFAAAVALRFAHDAALMTLPMQVTFERRQVPEGIDGMLQVAATAGAIVSGVAALRLGPRVTTAVGAALAAAANLVLALTALPVQPAAVVLGLGVGMSVPCFLAAAVQTLAGDDSGTPALHRVTGVLACAVAYRASEHIEGALAPMLFGAASLRVSTRLLHLVFAVLMLLALGLAVGSARRARSAGEAAALPRGRRSGGLLVGLVLVGAPYAAYRFGYAAWAMRRVQQLVRSDMAAILAGLSAGMLISIGALVALVLAAARRASWTPVVYYGAGLVLAALGLVAASIGDSPAIHAVGAALGVMTSVVVSAVPATYAALAVRRRAAALAVAGWTACSALAVSAGLAVRQDAALWFSVLACAGGGLALVRYGRALERKYFGARAPRRSKRRGSIVVAPP